MSKITYFIMTIKKYKDKQNNVLETWVRWVTLGLNFLENNIKIKTDEMSYPKHINNL